MIRATGVTHKYADSEVLSNINLTVEKGECVCVMGSSGGGKTTLLRGISGLMRPTKGTVELFGTDFYAADQRVQDDIRKRIGVVFQAAALFDYLNVRDNVLFGIERQRRMTKADKDELAQERLEVVGLKDAGSKMPGELSGGMRKRVGVARALASNPELLFFDEPTAGLDPVTAYSIDSLIVEVNEKMHTTSIVVTHELASVMRVATRVVFLSEGKILLDDSPANFRRTHLPEISELISKATAMELSGG